MCMSVYVCVCAWVRKPVYASACLPVPVSVSGCLVVCVPVHAFDLAYTSIPCHAHLLSLVLAQVVAKVAKFSRDSPGQRVIGSLLGMQNKTNLEVTDCFVIPDMRKTGDEGEADEEDTNTEVDNERMQRFKDDMLKAMRDVNADFDEVGLFQVRLCLLCSIHCTKQSKLLVAILAHLFVGVQACCGCFLPFLLSVFPSSLLPFFPSFFLS